MPKQSDRGVPIGGHLSAQLAELWTLAQELTLVFGEEKTVLEARWREAVNAESPLLPQSIREVRLSITDPVEVCHASSHPSHLMDRTLASTDRASVSRGIIREDGFGGWWSPTDSSFGFLQVAGTIDLLVT